MEGAGIRMSGAGERKIAMRSAFPRSVLALFSAVVASSVLAQLPDNTAHWKSTIEVNGGEGAGPMQSEIWMKGGRLRMKTQVLGMTQNFVRSGDTIYQWTEGQKSGMKMGAAQGASSGASADYVGRIAEYRTRGRKTGAESLDGHPCEIYELSVPIAPGRARKETVWLASDLHGFPLQVIAESEGGRITSRNRDVTFTTPIPDAVLAIPPDVLFRDLSDVLPRGQMPRR